MSDYRDFLPAQRFLRLISITADGTNVAYITDTSGMFNLWVQPVTGGPAKQLTFFTGQSVRDVAWSPDGSRLAFTAEAGGGEQTQIYLVDAAGGPVTRLSDAADRQFVIAEKTPFDLTGRYLLCGGNDRDAAVPDLILYDLGDLSYVRYNGLASGHVFPLAISPDGSRLLGGVITSNTDCQCCVTAVDDPRGLEVITGNLPGHYFYPAPWDGHDSFYARTTVDGGPVSLALVSSRTRQLATVDIPGWDVQDVVVSRDGRTVVWTVNEDGRSVLRGRRDGVPVDMPPIPDGVIDAMSISADGSALAVMINTPSRPLQPAVIGIASGEPLRYLTDPRPPVLRSASSVTPELCRYPAQDGTPIPALLYRPRGDGPNPVVLSIHGGPELQARPWYNALTQCLLAAGIAVFEPNVRGSSGYGHAWQTRIYRDWGGIDLDDFGAAAEYLKAQDWVDPGRVAVMGRSYGGFGALSCMTRLPGLWAAGVSVCGPANLDTFARAIPPEWASVVSDMFGDIDQDAEKLRLRSPITYADQIKAPLLVVQGANDTRVPKAESDQIVAAARANGLDVSYLVFEDEGHVFTSRDNDLRAHSAIAEFLITHLHPVP